MSSCPGAFNARVSEADWLVKDLHAATLVSVNMRESLAFSWQVVLGQSDSPASAVYDDSPNVSPDEMLYVFAGFWGLAQL